MARQLSKVQQITADALLNELRQVNAKVSAFAQLADLQAQQADLKAALDAIDPAILNPPVVADPTIPATPVTTK